MQSSQPDVQLSRSLGLWSALSLVIGTIIGVGIFVRQAAVLQETGSTTGALLAWFAGGLITLTAGLTIAEIASQMPHTGGLYVYMEKMYGRLWGFLSGWMQIIVYGPAMIASLGAYLAILLRDFFHIGGGWQIPIALIAVTAVSLLNLMSNRYGATFAIVTTICKLIPIAAIIIFGLFFGNANALSQSIQTVGQAAHSQVGSFGVAILGTLYAFDGWILVANLGGEIKNPRKMLPRAITLGISIVLVIYLFVTFGVFRSIPAQQISRLGTGAIPYLAIKDFGQVGGKILSIGIIISIVGCMNGKVMTFPRIMYAMARDHELPGHRILAYLPSKSRTPIFCTLATLIISGLMIIFANADWLSEICIFTVYCFYVAAFLGVFKLRREHPHLKRAFSVPLFPLTPIVAILGALFVLVSEVFNDPLGVLISFIFVGIGVPIYYYELRKAQSDGFKPQNHDEPLE